MNIKISRPKKTLSSYQFQIEVYSSKQEDNRHVIGILDSNFEIPHHEVWDSVLPLMYATRNGGPIFNKTSEPVQIEIDYPVATAAADFFEQRSHNMGLDVSIVSPRKLITFDLSTKGDVLLFGGGKDSRLLLGSLQEIGKNPTIVSARGSEYASDLEGVKSYQTIGFSMPLRIVPGLMLRPKNVYHGSGLGEVHLHTPWQKFFDISAPQPLFETSQMLKSLGLDISFEVPQCVLPFNVVQKILAQRYPELYEKQISVKKEATTAKNLHISLLERYHGLSHEGHCSEMLFRKLLDRFIARSTATTQFGFRDNQQVIAMEKQGIIRSLLDRGDLNWLNMVPPSHWEANWINKIHTYCNPDLQPEFLSIYKQYADVFDSSDSKRELPEGLRSYFHS